MRESSITPKKYFYYLKLSVFFIFSFATFVTIFTFYQYEKYKLIREQKFQQVQRLSHALSEKFSFFYHNVQHIALNESVKAMNRPNASLYFNSLIALYPEYDLIYLVDKQGRFLTSNTLGDEGERLSPAKVRGKTITSEPWFKELTDKRDLQDLEKSLLGTYVTSVQKSELISQLYDREKRGFSFIVPVLDNQQVVQGYIISFVNEQWPAKQIQEIIKSESFSQFSTGDIFLVDGQNQLLACVGCDQENLPSLQDIVSLNPITHWRDAGVDGIVSFIKNLTSSSFYSISHFRHQSFPSALDWSLVFKAGQLQVIGPLLYYAKVFVLVFLMMSLTSLVFFKLLRRYEEETVEDVNVLRFPELLNKEDEAITKAEIMAITKHAKLLLADMRPTESFGEDQRFDLIAVRNVVRSYIGAKNFFDSKVECALSKDLETIKSSQKKVKSVQEQLSLMVGELSNERCPVVRQHHSQFRLEQVFYHLAELEEYHTASYECIALLEAGLKAKHKNGTDRFEKDFIHIANALQWANVRCLGLNQLMNLKDYDQLEKYLDLIKSHVKNDHETLSDAA